ncbi:MAG: methylenetetrahydrofolate--tRNA-(uracil(54)-C(5))-methyltransferase (FADH(2)-oxidizing) TrmFO, partial [Oscillospiraceae bacterium]|nr:methylenetetrahydrofolate--tRNA-(uracil(54)-C(5))-methyltransferase (FADH(2)-oxidizing) TrmFO [Oscillospiraceae bacterium]
VLYEMKPDKRSPAHQLPGFAELVCSNSLKAARTDSAAGLLKAEMRILGSLCLQVADTCAVPAGGALAVDRLLFSERMTAAIAAHPLIEVVRREAETVPAGPAIIAAGPLTSDSLAADIRRLCGGALSFFDAAAPIVAAESVDSEHAFFSSRYDDGPGDYLNCPLNKAEYEAFHAALIAAETAPLAAFDKQQIYEGCMPIEVLAKRGADAIRFGPMKPVGLRDPRTGHRPWANLQLRRENAAGSLYNLVGFQTNLKFPEQKRVFGLIPALKNAEYMRHGVMHRNTFIDSPRLLTPGYRFRKQSGAINQKATDNCQLSNTDRTRSVVNCQLFFAGQITGVEGYMESAASGILAGINMVRAVQGKPELILPKTTMMGALAGYISGSDASARDPTVTDFQPMGANFGILPPIEPWIRDKKSRYAALAERGLMEMHNAQCIIHNEMNNK